VFEEFRSIPLPGEPDNACHVIEPFEIPQWWPKIIAIDWGYRHGNYVCWGAVSPYGELIIYREYLSHFTSIVTWASNAKRMSQNDGNIVRTVADRICFRRLGEDKTLAEQIFAATGWPLAQAIDDRIAGKQLLHELFRWTVRPTKYEIDQSAFDQERAQFILRHKGLEAYRAYVNAFIPDDTNEHLPKFKVFSTCTAFIDCIQSLIYDESARSEDVKKVDGDDPYDGARYCAMEYDRYIKESRDEMKKRGDLEAALEHVRRTGDYNTFYNRLDIIEKANLPPAPLYRPHRIRQHGRIRVH
ncbi:MAG: hypothetical protein MN733_40500, partial [Nitrososphaera sp.]|nr:hypothetical protein [Nitrososphaera sp.]